MQCDKCGSDNTQRLEMVYESGTQKIQTTGLTAGGGYGRGGFGGIASTSTSGTSSSLIAKRATPPQKKAGVFISIIMIIIGLFLIFNTGGIGFPSLGVLLIIGSIFLIKSVSNYNNNEYPSLYKKWQNQWLCHKCGSIYEQA